MQQPPGNSALPVIEQPLCLQAPGLTLPPLFLTEAGQMTWRPFFLRAFSTFLPVGEELRAMKPLVVRRFLRSGQVGSGVREDEGLQLGACACGWMCRGALCMHGAQ
jgi:hypothetical protein